MKDKTKEELIEEINLSRKQIMELEKFRVLFETSHDAIMTLEPPFWKFTSCNLATVQLFGAKDEVEFISKIPSDISPEFQPGGARSSEMAIKMIQQAMDEGVAFFKWTHKRFDGKEFFATVLLTRVEIEKGKPFLQATVRDITELKQIEAEREMTLKRQQDINILQQLLLAPGPLQDKLRIITDSIILIFNADFCRIWLIRPGDLCEKGCIHAQVKEGPHVCRFRDKCLHLMVSSGRYTHIDGRDHARVPFGCYKIGNIASNIEHKFLTNDVVNDPKVHNHEWARQLGLVSFAGYQLKVPGKEAIGVLALFSKHPIMPAEDVALDNLSVTVAFITQQATLQEELANAYSGLEDKIKERTKELQQSEEKLRASSFYSRSLIEASLDPFVTISKEGKITDVNEATTKATGVSREKLVGTDFSDYFTEPEKARQGYEQVFAKEFVSGYPLTIRHKDGELMDVLYNATVYKDDKGNVLGVLAVARDVTELKYMQDKLIRSEKMVVVGQLASSVAHELRNPLGVMKNALYYLNMLELGKDKPDVKENMDIIANEIENSDKVISDLLEFSRIKQPALRLEDINLIIKEALSRVRTPADVKVVTELDGNLPQIQVDALQMQQIFYNLAQNAIQAMEKGGTLNLSSRLTHDKTIAIIFKDTGCGIQKENLQKIFDPLFSTKAKGTGLGLSVVASLVEGHGGNIAIESEVNKGSTFTVNLPINRG